MYYLKRFLFLKDLISASKWFEVRRFEYALQNESTIDRIKSQTGILPSSVIDFYKEINEIKLEWGLKSKFFNDKKVNPTIRKEMMFDSLDKPLGCINIINFEDFLVSSKMLKQVLSPASASMDVIFNNHNYSNETLSDIIMPIDRYDVVNDSDCMALVVSEDDKDTVIMLTDYYADWFQSYRIDFNSYLEILFVTAGSFKRRREIFSITGGDNKPKLVFDKNSSQKFAVDFSS